MHILRVIVSLTDKKGEKNKMKKTFSVFLSFVMLFTCLCVGGISAQAAEKKTKIYI